MSDPIQLPPLAPATQGVDVPGDLPQVDIYPAPPYGAALSVDDPPLIGGYWLDGRLAARAAGVTYLAHDEAGTSVMLVMLSEGASGDAGARDRLAGEVNKMHRDTVLARGGTGQDEGRMADKFISDIDSPIAESISEVDEPLAPWVALAYDGSQEAVLEANRLLRSVELSSTPQLGEERGPNFELPWIRKTSPGSWRLWPLSWPRNKNRAGWVSILASWLLMLLLTALALLIVVLLFQNTPPVSPPPPVPTSGSGSGGGSGSPESPESPDSPESGSPESPESGSPEPPESGSPSESSSDSGEPSESGSLSPSESGSGDPKSPTKTPSMMSSAPSGTGDAPTQNTKL
ncbi:MAG: hypothetical protein LBM94_07105 [Propionibacteriaceae bacterium]|jgi:hypothetical protein|nr:hypothetical protein [Propionibacteriaceae bacterium]